MLHLLNILYSLEWFAAAILGFTFYSRKTYVYLRYEERLWRKYVKNGKPMSYSKACKTELPKLW